MADVNACINDLRQKQVDVNLWINKVLGGVAGENNDKILVSMK